MEVEEEEEGDEEEAAVVEVVAVVGEGNFRQGRTDQLDSHETRRVGGSFLMMKTWHYFPETGPS